MKGSILIAGLLHLVTCASVRAIITVQLYSIGTPLSCSPSSTIPYSSWTVASGNAITIPSDGCMTHVRVWSSNPTQEHIGRITITGSFSPSTVYLQVYNPSTLGPAGMDFGGLSVSNATVRDRVRLTTVFTGNLTDTVDAGDVIITAGGAIQAAVHGRKNAGSGLQVAAASTTSSGTIEAHDNFIDYVDVTGTIAGKITSTGSILSVLCASLQADVEANAWLGLGIATIDVSGNIGTVTSPVTIYSVGPIRLVSSARAWASISTPASGVNGSGRIHRIVTTTGDFIGSITTDALDSSNPPLSGLDIAGDLDADITCKWYCASRTITVDGALPAGRTISMGAGWYHGGTENRQMSFGSLEGQIIINTLNNTNEVWTGPISVGSVGNLLASPNNGPYYTATSASLGGGAVGLVPYHLHGTDCSPANGYIGGTPLDSTVRLRWYGPLQWTSGNPVTVEYWNGSAWINISSSFSYSINPSNPRELRIVPNDFFMDWSLVDYRIKPTSNLKCAGTTGATVPAVYGSDEYLVYFE
jgi:hypothetical protein